MSTIVAQSLSRCYGSIKAVSDLSFEVDQPTVVGVLGPNGAGKSTTMKMLTGYLQPTSGLAFINGHDVHRHRRQALQCLGYLPEGAPMYPEMTVWAFLNFVASVRSMRGLEKSKAIDYVVERLDLSSVLHQTIDTLSKGFARRLGMAQAMIHDPPILILDEPTDGLDPIQKNGVRRLIQEMAPRKIIIISTHILEEVELLCQRIMVIAHGELRLDTTPLGMRQRSRYCGAVSMVIDQPQAKASMISNLPEVKAVELRAGRLTAFPSGHGQLSSALQKLIQDQGWLVTDFHQEAGRLEDVFAAVTGVG